MLVVQTTAAEAEVLAAFLELVPALGGLLEAPEAPVAQDAMVGRQEVLGLLEEVELMDLLGAADPVEAPGAPALVDLLMRLSLVHTIPELSTRRRVEMSLQLAEASKDALEANWCTSVI